LGTLILWSAADIGLIRRAFRLCIPYVHFNSVRFAKLVRGRVPEVHFEFSDFGFEMTSLSDFKITDFGISDSEF